MKTLLEFPVLIRGWECDPDGWVKERADGSRILILTNHGRPYRATPQDVRDLMTTYREAIVESQKALDLLEGK